MIYFFGPKAYKILAPRPGIEQAALALEGEILTTGLLGKSPVHKFWKHQALDKALWAAFYNCCTLYSHSRHESTKEVIDGSPEAVMASKA